MYGWIEEWMDGQVDSTHVWGGVDAVSVDDHRRRVGLQDKSMPTIINMLG